MIAPRRAFGLRIVGPAAVVVTTLGFSALGGVGRLPVSGIEIPLAFVGVTGLMVLLLRIELGVALLPLIATAVPFSIGTGTQTKIVAGLMVAGLLLAMWVIRSLLAREIQIVRSPLYLPSLALMVVWTLSYVYSNAVRPPLIQPWSSFALAQAGGLAVVLISIGILLLALNAGWQLRYLQIATWSIVAIGAIWGLNYYVKLPLIEEALNPFAINGLFTMWTVALAYGQALFNQSLPRWVRWGLVCLAAAWMFKSAIRETWYFSGWGPTLVVVVVLTLLWSRRAFAVLGLIILPIVALNLEAIVQIVWGLTVSKGDLTRLDIWELQFDLIRQYPLLGTGPAGYAVYNVNLYASSIYAMSTHSNYLDVLDQTGVAGGLIFIWFLLTLFVLGWRACRRYRFGFAGGFANAAAAGLIGVIFAMGLGDWFIPFVYNQTIAGFRWTAHSWIFLGFLAALGAKEPVIEAD